MTQVGKRQSEASQQALEEVGKGASAWEDTHLAMI